MLILKLTCAYAGAAKALAASVSDRSRFRVVLVRLILGSFVGTDAILALHADLLGALAHAMDESS
jgi:hypothetical protein